MQKFEYDGLFELISKQERADYWVLFRDSKRKVLNVEREFSIKISKLEAFSAHKYTIRGGGQNLRSRQLSEIRHVCRLLGVSSLHGQNNLILDTERLEQVKDYV